MALTIRPPTPTEIDEIAKQWVSSFEPGSTPTIGSPARTLTCRHWRRMHRMLVGALLSESTVLVAVPDGEREYVGWICHDATTVHYVYAIPNGGRRKGLGRYLLHYVGLTSYSHMTAGGEALLAAMNRRVA